jgi:hypothetical protein
MNDQILTELIAIRQLLERAIAAPPATRQAAPAPAGQVAIPQPSQLVADPGSVAVHFGKNAGQPLSSLNDRSVEWYAMPKEPRVGANGKPFPPRASDEQLANAARQLYHAKRGTLVGKAPIAEMSFAPGGSVTADGIEENVPF